ncbi:serine hydroxymethyltransferase [Candidatus Parcubacteria bacterium]|nr:MAG: serine hydroxymethyltransferase [Candidatus Parcubacteria bacterium]
MNYENLKKVDKESYKIFVAEQARQQDYINLIPSENYTSEAVLEALASVFVNKYSEGYPKARYYPGNENVDQIELLGQERARKLFKLGKEWFVNVQPYSGSPANLAVYIGLLGKDDTALGMELAAGGHLTHGHKVSASGKLFNFIQYGVSWDGVIDYKKLEELAKEKKPKLIVAGTTAYPRTLDFKRFKQIANSVKALLMVDMAHIAGLVAAGVHPSPFPYADIVTTTTHKTLRGPRGAIIFAKNKELAEKIDRAVFPGIQGGPHDNQTLAIAAALKEAASEKFQKYASNIVRNAKILSIELSKHGFELVSGGTDNHLMLIDLKNKGISGRQAEEWLYQAGIIVNRNAVPFDPRKPIDPSGIRLGTPAVTTRGMGKSEMKKIATWIKEVIFNPKSVNKVRKETLSLTKKFPLSYRF